MKVQKRNGEFEAVSFDMVLKRLRLASKDLSVNPDALAQQVLSRIVNKIHTSELDELAAASAASLCTTHPDWGTLASRIAVSNHQKNTHAEFSKVIQILSNQKHKSGTPLSYVSDEIVKLVEEHGPAIDAYINHERDYVFDYFGFKTLEKSYLLKDTSMKIVERPQHMWMRVALGIWGDTQNLKKAFETYDLLSLKFMTHATPTLFNAGTPRPQLSSCYLLSMAADSISGIYKTLSDCASISKYAGGIGLHLHNIRARGSLIRGTNGTSNGIIPMLRVFNNTARYVDQCFVPSTLVFTQAGPKAIEDVGITDKVLTSSGNYEAVRLPIRHEYSGQMLDIQVKNAIYPVRVTPEHQILALQNQAKGLNFDLIRNRLDKNLCTVGFVDAKDLLPGDFLVFPIPTYEMDLPGLSEEDCRFYGILLGDGHISHSVSGVCLNNTSKKDVLEFITNYLSNRGITHNTYTCEESVSTIRVKWSTTSPGFKFTRAQLYDSNKQKKIDTALLHLPITKITQILRGIIETDGCVGTKEIAVELSSYPLIEDIRYLLLRLGALASGYERNRVGNVSSTRDIITNLPTAVVRIPRIPEILAMFPNAPTGEFFSYLRHDNNIYSRIQSITETNYEGIVHDFEIEGPHDYVVSHLGVAHNGGGKRNGSFAMYLEPWHADVEDFLRMKLNTGAEDERARDLFYALWIPDLFMERVEADASWSLFCPDEAPGLADVWGDEFKALYTKYEAEGRAKKVVSARKLWFQTLDSQMETGTPYLLYKDAANAKSNQKNLGTIKSSNLCTEIIEYSSPDETAVCNLASIALSSFVGSSFGAPFDFDALRQVVRNSVRNLNRVIDINFYPTPETKKSNMRHRPIGVGVQGLADVFAALHLNWESETAATLNQLIFEHMYYAAIDESANIALEEGPYETFNGSPVSQGLLQPDMWSVKPISESDNSLDWAALRAKASKGIRNSLLVAPMPTASTSQILGSNECFEPFTSNLYTRRTLAGEYVVVNKHLMRELISLGLWNDALKQEIVLNNGSVQTIKSIPEEMRLRYKTAWEIPQKVLIDMAAARGAFICQSQSLNLFMADPTYSKLTSMHFYAWKKGLKTGCYYLRTKAPVSAQKFTVDPRLLAAIAGTPVAKAEDDVPEYEDDTSDEEESAPVPVQTVVETRAQKLDRLAKEYEEEQAKAKAAADAGEGCLFCSA
jgi:ribonucleoside-diphosphate reductase alpha chain